MNTAYYVGDADIDLVEMDVYDAYREDDGKLPSNTYLLKCNKKLRWKINHANIMIRKLERQNLKEKLENENSKERIRKFYETIAFGRSRAGRMVREAMGTSKAAQEISQELKALYDVSKDSDYE